LPMSRGMSSLEDRECVEVKDISFPTASARMNSRDSNAQGLTMDTDEHKSCTLAKNNAPHHHEWMYQVLGL
jgi:hypothetical protein